MKKTKTSISKYLSDDDSREAHVMEGEENVLLLFYKEGHLFNSKIYDKVKIEEAEADAEDYVTRGI